MAFHFLRAFEPLLLPCALQHHSTHLWLPPPCCPTGQELRLKGINRIGNMLVPNSNYCKFEDWIMAILDQMKVEQDRDGTNWTPSKMIHRFGREINNPSSVYYWAYKHDIPVFCPALTDGSIGDMMFFHSWKCPGLRCDIVEDIRLINMQVRRVYFHLALLHQS